MESVPRRVGVATGSQLMSTGLSAKATTRSLPLPVLISTLITLALLPGASSFRIQAQNPDTLFLVEKDGKSGYIDRIGKVVIPLQFDSANDFHEGLALVMTGGEKFFVDPSGRVLIKARFDIVNNFSEGLAAVNNGQVRNSIGLIANPGKWGYIDRTGKLAIPMKFTHAEDFSEGLAAVQDGSRAGFIDHTGK